jgi:hypothetical protein
VAGYPWIHTLCKEDLTADYAHTAVGKHRDLTLAWLVMKGSSAVEDAQPATMSKVQQAMSEAIRVDLCRDRRSKAARALNAKPMQVCALQHLHREVEFASRLSADIRLSNSDLQARAECKSAVVTLGDHLKTGQR